MFELKIDTEQSMEVLPHNVPLAFHPSYYAVSEKLQKWLKRFAHAADESITTDLLLFYLLAAKRFLDHRNSSHLFRMVLSLHQMQKKLLHGITAFPHKRQLEIRWMPTSLLFPFSRKPVLGCLIGFNVMDRYEMFDEENIVLALKKHLPQLRLVNESSYSHTSQYKNTKIFYFEVEKKDASAFSLEERNILKENFEDKVKNSIQMLSPSIFMVSNEEEIYKNILVLSEEIQSLEDIPQVYITLDRQTGKEVTFRVALVHILPSQQFSLKDRFPANMFVSQRILTVRHLDTHPIEAHLFRLHLPRDSSMLRSDGSLDFYSARQAVAEFVRSAIGNFRDYNGGIILKQQELLHSFKNSFAEVAQRDPELMETFFYTLAPLENQVVLQQEVLSALFTYFLAHRKEKLPDDLPYRCKIYNGENRTFLIVHGANNSLTKIVSSLLQEYAFKTQEIAYNIVETADGVFFNCVFLDQKAQNKDLFLGALEESLWGWYQKRKNRQVLRVGLEFSLVSLDPRIGGEANSGDVLRFLFEGLTRFNKNAKVEYAIAESITISPNGKEYIFKLRPSLWNDGSLLTAYDFEYAWKKILSADFKTAFSHLFFSIKNAKAAKEGKVPAEQIGIHVLDDLTLKVELVHPVPYFLHLTTHPLFAPVHRLIDQHHPQWPYQSGKNYPCNGPFQLKINEPSHGYHLVKNPQYWDAGTVLLDQVTFTKMNSTQAAQAFRKKEIDWVGNPFGSWDPTYGKEEKIVSFSNQWVLWLVFNTTQPPFHNSKLRRAFGYVIQRAQLSAGIWFPTTPAYSPSPLKDSEGPRSLYPDFDMQTARQLFAEALDELGMHKNDFPSINFVYGETRTQNIIAPILKQQFKEFLDIECEMQALSWNKVFSKMSKGEYQMGLMQWTALFDDPIYTLNAFKSTKQEINFSKWENSDFQHLLDLAEQEVGDRSSYLVKAEKILCEEMPIIPLFYHSQHAMIAKDLVISNKNPCGAHNISKSFYNRTEN